MTSNSNREADADLSCLCRQVCAGAGTIVIVALIFLIAAIVWVKVRGPVYEATAYAEVDTLTDIATVEQKLRFPSLYQKVAGSEDAARDLTESTRVKALRNSRLIAVSVRDGDPAQAASSADAIIEGFIDSDFGKEKETATELRARIQAINELSDRNSLVSPLALLDALHAHKASIEKSGKQDPSSMELAVIKQQLIESRVAEYLKIRRPQLGLPALEQKDGFDSEAALKTTIAELADLYTNRGELDARARELEANTGFEDRAATIRLAEHATPPAQPVAPGVIIVCLGAIVLGGFSGVLLVLLRTS